MSIAVQMMPLCLEYLISNQDLSSELNLNGSPNLELLCTHYISVCELVLHSVSQLVIFPTWC